MRQMNLPNVQPIPNALEEQPEFAIPLRLKQEAEELLTHYPQKRSASLMLLHLVQEEFGFVSRQATEWVADVLELQPINIYELVTFYPMFQRKKVGKTHFRVCRTLSCALAGSQTLYSYLCGDLGLDPHGHGAQTTPDGKFTVEFVECLAGCGTAPVVMCNDVMHEGITKERLQEMLQQGKAAR